MKTLRISISLIAMCLGASSLMAVASDKADLMPLKLAVIKGSVGSHEIVAGEYLTGLEKLTTAGKKALSTYEHATGVCVANYKLHNYKKANAACSQAIDALASLKARSSRSKFIKSIAYSNRSVVRLASDDNVGALADLNRALSANKNNIVKNNMAAFKALEVDYEHSESSTFSD